MFHAGADANPAEVHPMVCRMADDAESGTIDGDVTGRETWRGA